MADSYGYSIVLSGKVDPTTLRNSIKSALKGIEFKITLDQQSIRSQVQNALKGLKINVGVGNGSGGGGGGGTGGAAELDTTGASSVRTTFNAAGEKIAETAKTIDDATHSTTRYWDATKGLTKTVTEFSDKVSVQADKSYDRLRGRIDALSQSNVVGAKNIKYFNERLAEINEIDDPSKRLTEFQKLNQEISDTKKQSMGLAKQISTAMGKFLIWSAVTVTYFALVRKLKDVVVQVKAIDDALVELKKVSDLTGQEVEELTDRAFALGEAVAKTGVQVINAITEIKRAGYELAESEYLAKYALMMTNVAEGIDDAGEAAKIFVSILKGTGKDITYASTLLDEMNQISNNAAINFDNLATMTQRISGTLHTLGVDTEQTMGLITGAYEVLQDERVAKGLSVIGLRMQGLNEDLEEEAGLQSKVNEALEKYAGISVFDSRTGQLRDYYNVLEELAGVWNKISKNAQVYLTTTLAGKNRADVLTALMTNWKGVENAIQQANDSLGSAEKEQENYINSISGKLAQLSSAWQDLARTSWESDWSKGLTDMATAILTVIRYGGGLIPVIAAATTTIIAFKVASTGATIAFGGLAAAIAAVVTIIGLINKAEADRKAALEESNRKIQENIDKVKTQYDKYSELRGEVDSLKEEQERLMAIENKTAEQKKQLTQITKQLAAAQKELNQYVGEGAGVTGEYSLALLKQMGAAAGKYIRNKQNIENYDAAKTYLSKSKFGSFSYSGWEVGQEVRAKQYGISATRLPSGYEMLEFEGSIDEYITALENLYNHFYQIDEELALEMKEISEQVKAEKEAYQETISTFEKYQGMAQLYGDVNVKAIDDLQMAYQKWTNATDVQKVAMMEAGGELRMALAAVENLKAQYPAATSEIDSFTSSILESVQAFKQQDRYIDEVNKRISKLREEQAAWEEEVEERKSAEELTEKRQAVADAEKALAEARGEVTDTEKARLEMQLEIAKAQLEALELADKETQEKKKQLDYEEKVYAVQKAEAELSKAKDKKIQVFRAGQGMVYISDYSAVEAASRSLTSARQSLTEYSTEKAAEKSKEQAQAAIDKAQEALDTYNEKVKQTEDIAAAEEKLEKARQTLADYEKKLGFASKISTLESAIDLYNDLTLKYGASAVRAMVDKNLGALGTSDLFAFLSAFSPERTFAGEAPSVTGTGTAIDNVAARIGNYVSDILLKDESGILPLIKGDNNNVGGETNYYQVENVYIDGADTLPAAFEELKNKTILIKGKPETVRG